MGFIDTHSHIYEPDFLEDVDDVIARAKEAGVDRILLPNINATSVSPMLDLSKKHPGFLFPMMGLHPEDVKGDFNEVLNGMHEMLSQKDNPFIAVGEVGLDYYWDKTFFMEQQDAFRQQIEWALEFDLPLMIHCRSAHSELVSILREYDGTRLSGVFHCFAGTSDEACELLSFDNFLLGIGGVLTFKKSTLPDVLKVVPMERVVIETDAPYLAPVPHRGKRNEPAFAKHTAQRLSEVYGVDLDELMMCTNNNVQRVFKRINA